MVNGETVQRKLSPTPGKYDLVGETKYPLQILPGTHEWTQE